MPNTMKDSAEQGSFNCGEKGHYAHMCPKPQPHPNQTPTTNPSPNQGANSVSTTVRQNHARGRVNQVAMIDAHNVLIDGPF
jgi:hypothetical protein